MAAVAIVVVVLLFSSSLLSSEAAAVVGEAVVSAAAAAVSSSVSSTCNCVTFTVLLRLAVQLSGTTQSAQPWTVVQRLPGWASDRDISQT